MTGLCLLLAVLAVLLGVTRPMAHDVRQRLAVEQPRRRALSRRGASVVAVLGLTAVLVGAASASGGAPAAVLVAVSIIVALTCRWLWLQRMRSRSALKAQTDVAHACEVLAAHLRVGQVATEALVVAATDCPVLVEARQVQAVGGDVTTVWRRQAGQPGHLGLLELARAWQVSIDTGAPLSAALEQVAASLAAEQSLRTVVAGELAAPRATSKVMAALPACGIGMGYLLGGDPIDWLLGGPAGWACLILGVGLACSGVMWIELLARHASVQG